MNQGQQEVWLIACLVAVLLLSPLYGYWIGKVAKRRSWRGRTIGLAAAVPPGLLGCAVYIALVIVHHGTASHESPTASGASVFCAPLVAGIVAKKIAGVPMKDSAVEKLSIR